MGNIFLFFKFYKTDEILKLMLEELLDKKAINKERLNYFKKINGYSNSHDEAISEGVTIIKYQKL